MQNPIVYRQAVQDDYPQLLAVAEPYYRDTPRIDKSRGSLNGHFSSALFDKINHNLALLVADDSGTMQGFLGLAPYSAQSPSSVIQSMFTVLPELRYQNQRVDSLNPFVFGPVCVALGAQGKGIFRGLYQAMWDFLPAERYSFGVAFINKANLHSLDVHVKALSAVVIGEFMADGEAFWVIGYHRPGRANVTS